MLWSENMFAKQEKDEGALLNLNDNGFFIWIRSVKLGLLQRIALGCISLQRQRILSNHSVHFNSITSVVESGVQGCVCVHLSNMFHGLHLTLLHPSPAPRKRKGKKKK